MTTRWLEGALYLLAAAFSSVAAWIVTHPALPHPIVSIAPSLGPMAPQHPTTDSLEDAIALITAENLFRPERASAKDADVASGVPMGTQAVVKPPKPNLVLRGVIGGPPWDAILDGVPGHTSSMVIRTGQRTGDLEVRAVRHDTVFIKGMDTTWTLTLRHP